MDKMSIGRADFIQRKMEKYNSSPYYKKKYVTDRSNSLAQIKRDYLYLVGNLKGYSLFEKVIKNTSPEANKSILKNGTHVEWHLDTEEVWDVFTSDSKLSTIIKGRDIKTYDELCYRADIYMKK